MLPNKRLLTVPLLIVALMAASLTQTACGPKDIDTMAKASRELAADTLNAEKVVAEFYLAGKLSKAKKDSYADKFKVIGTKGKAFNDIIVDLSRQYPDAKSVPADKAQFLRDAWQPLSLLIASVIGELLNDGVKDAGKLDDHAAKIDKVLK